MIISFCQYRNLSHFYCQTNVINDVLSFKYYRKDRLFIYFIAKINMEERRKKIRTFRKKGFRFVCLQFCIWNIKMNKRTHCSSSKRLNCFVTVVTTNLIVHRIKQQTFKTIIFMWIQIQILKQLFVSVIAIMTQVDKYRVRIRTIVNERFLLGKSPYFSVYSHRDIRS